MVTPKRITTGNFLVHITEGGKQRPTGMKLNFQGRVNNVTLPFSRSLLPVFEAIINSFHAIEDHGGKDRFIRIRVLRNTSEPRQTNAITGRLSSRTILGFQVEDNGIGFTPANFDSFETSDSDHKRARGAKGVGRFMWLKAFDSVYISSTFKNGDGHLKRTFDFRLTENGIVNNKVEPADTKESGTIVELRGFKDKYAEECPRTAQTIAERIVEHCLSYFLQPNCPSLMLDDEDEDNPIDLNAIYRDEIQGNVKRSKMKCEGVVLNIEHVRVFAGEFSEHTIHLCANGRDVQHLALGKFLPYAPARFRTPEGKLFVYKAYVSSPFLDTRVNAERTGFNLCQEGDLQSQSEPTDKQLLESVVASASAELGPLLSEVEDKIKKRIDNLITTTYPEYRPIAKEVDSYIREFRENADDKEIVIKLNDIQFREDMAAREKVKQLLDEKDQEVRRSAKYQQLREAYTEKASEIAKSRLAQCVIHRRIILDLLEVQVSAGANGEKFPREEKIHELIFPMRKTSDEVAWDRQNLWIIDERLAYHHFLASDKPIKSFSTNKDAKDEPDLFVLNHPSVFTDSSDVPLNSAIIVEFKRAEREEYDENPVQQIYRYIKKLQDQKVHDARGRSIQIHPHATFHCYIVADLTTKLRTMLEESGFDPTPDASGYMFYNRNFRAYVEVISYDKLLKDSNDRNRELFKALSFA
ncbi:MAG: hypothetical protein QOI16_4597 [Pseudonocardiales bacterium]|jgi:hypothetical protein|nr:hypothetical protein [Pseudonocardiales bacterium]